MWSSVSDLGTISFATPGQIGSGRERVLRAAQLLGVSEEAATRLATLVSQVGAHRRRHAPVPDSRAPDGR